MICPYCNFENPKGMKFCGNCGMKYISICPKCSFSNPGTFKFCGQCGFPFENKKHKHADSNSIPETIKTTVKSERKYVTVLFSDLTGYTEMSENLDPEEVKKITANIFSYLSKIIEKYNGFIEKYIGDAILAVFGAVDAFEDSALRAIKAAREIHTYVSSLTPIYEKKIGRRLCMHTGINTGLVVTGNIDFKRGTHGLVGDTINTAARLMSISKNDQIIVDHGSFIQTSGYFNFQPLSPVKVKGKIKPLRAYIVSTPLKDPKKLHRVFGLRSDLIGRNVEKNKLVQAAKELRNKKIGSVVTICGTAGTGKSRLVEDFKKYINKEDIEWIEGQAFPFSQKTPYYPLIDLLNRTFLIDESDTRKEIKAKIQNSISSLTLNSHKISPYLGKLWSIKYKETENISPDVWKYKLIKSIRLLLSSLSRRKPTIICLEDLHWADPSSIVLIRDILLNNPIPILFICIYRPIITLFTANEIQLMRMVYKEIRLKDLSSDESQRMVESLLKNKSIPNELSVFIKSKVEGNPFYIEEIINSLIESGALKAKNGAWKITSKIDSSSLSPSIYGVVSGRIDRLEKDAKRILQEGAVIGRIFPYDILFRITKIKKRADKFLILLEGLDFLRTNSIYPEIEYIFKHALTQEVVYNGLIKKDRRDLHNRIAQIIENLFHDRVSDYYETLAFHFTRAGNLKKSVEYLLKSGNKSMLRYALKEANGFYKEAFTILIKELEKDNTNEYLLAKCLVMWCYVFNLEGNYNGLLDLLIQHEKIVDSLENCEDKGLFYTWLGWTLQRREILDKSYKYLQKALDIGETIENNKVIGYSCNWLIWTCTDLGLLDQASAYSDCALKQIENLKDDQNYHRYTLAGIGILNYVKGDIKGTFKISKELISIGESNSDRRAITHGFLYEGMAYYSKGKIEKAIDSFNKSVKISPDPVFSYNAKIFLGSIYLIKNQIDEAEKILIDILKFTNEFGAEYIGTAAQSLNSIVLISKGRLKEGINKAINTFEIYKENHSRWRQSTMLYLLGRVYAKIASSNGPKNYSLLLKNFTFLIKSVPLSFNISKNYFTESIRIANEIGAKNILSQSHYELGLLFLSKNKKNDALFHLTKAQNIFNLCGAFDRAAEADNALKKITISN